MPRLKIKLSKSTLVYVSLAVFIGLQIFFFLPYITQKKWETPSSSEALKNLKLQNESTGIEQKMVGVHLLENDEQQKGWELFAEEAQGSSEVQWVLKKVKVHFYSDETSSFTVTGDVGEVDGQSKNMSIRGNVITQSSNGYAFYTNELHYAAQGKRLFTTDSVKMQGPADKTGKGISLTGVGLEIKVAESKISILDQVEASKVVEGREFKINSNASVFSNKDREALFAGDVRMLYDSMSIRAPYAEFKYSKAKNNLQTVQVYDQVQLKDLLKSGTCRELLINFLTDTVTLSGDPKIKIGEDEVQGEQIILSERGKKLKIAQMKLQRESSPLAPPEKSIKK